VREEAGAPAPEDEAVAEDRAEVREGRELRGVVRGEDEGAQGEAEVDAALDRGRREEVSVDLGLGVVVVGEFGVEMGYLAVELGVARDELCSCCGGEVVVSPLGGSPASAGIKTRSALGQQKEYHATDRSSAVESISCQVCGRTHGRPNNL
jgi:hypothetical protein